MSRLSDRVPTVSRRTLLLFAGALWTFAGSKILAIGIPFVRESTLSPLVVGIASTVVFALFARFVFGPLYFKHRTRIVLQPAERANMFSFFDTRGYLVMAFMMALGIGLRRFSPVPHEYLGTFYLGLGSALLMGGLFFLKGFAVYRRVREKLLARGDAPGLVL